MSEVTVNKPRPTIKGIVVSDKMDKTCVIVLSRQVRHRLYLKSVKQRVKFFVHDEKNEAKVGDLIVAESTRPLSRNKNFRLLEILEKKAEA